VHPLAIVEGAGKRETRNKSSGYELVAFGAEIHVVIFELGRPVAPEGIFDAGAEGEPERFSLIGGVESGKNRVVLGKPLTRLRSKCAHAPPALTYSRARSIAKPSRPVAVANRVILVLQPTGATPALKKLTCH
jgi:hypothetical protein